MYLLSFSSLLISFFQHLSLFVSLYKFIGNLWNSTTIFSWSSQVSPVLDWLWEYCSIEDSFPQRRQKEKKQGRANFCIQRSDDLVFLWYTIVSTVRTMLRNWDNSYQTVSSRFLISVSSLRWSGGWDFEDCSNFRTPCKSSRRPAGGDAEDHDDHMLKKSWLRGAMGAGKILSFFFCEFNPNSKIVSSCLLGIACGTCRSRVAH